MARSRTKQGNRKHRRKLKTPDGRVLKDARGRPITMGVPHPMGVGERGDRRRRDHEERMAELAASEESKQRLEALARAEGTGS